MLIIFSRLDNAGYCSLSIIPIIIGSSPLKCVKKEMMTQSNSMITLVLPTNEHGEGNECHHPCKNRGSFGPVCQPNS